MNEHIRVKIRKAGLYQYQVAMDFHSNMFKHLFVGCALI